MSGRRIPWLLLGAALLLVANGRWILPLAAWLFPIGWLVFLDRSRRLSGLGLAFLAFLLIHFSIWWGIIPAPGIIYYIVAAIYAAAYFVPFVVHRLVAGRADAFLGTLVFPLAWVSAELVFSRWLTPYGSWASLTYTQSDSLALVQLASVTGIAGITFLMTWFASVVAWMLRPQVSGHRRLRAAAAYGVVMGVVVVSGQVRLTGHIDAESVRVAAIVPDAERLSALETLLQPVRQGRELAIADLGLIQEAASSLNEDLFKRTRREARAGARLIAWSETASRVFASEEEAFLAQASRVAAEENVILFLAVGVWHPDGTPPFENKVVVVDTSGVIALQYHKAHPIYGGESSLISAGAESVAGYEAGFGRVGAVICHDLDFPPLLRQASSASLDLVVAPSDDWDDVAPLHARMAVFRAVENGITLFRPTRGGRSMAVDSRGRITARVDMPDDAMVADIRIGRVGTVYGVTGDLFSWGCVAGLCVWLVLGARRARTSRIGE